MGLEYGIKNIEDVILVGVKRTYGPNVVYIHKTTVHGTPGRLYQVLGMTKVKILTVQTV